MLQMTTVSTVLNSVVSFHASLVHYFLRTNLRYAGSTRYWPVLMKCAAHGGQTVCFSLWAKNVRSGRSALRQPCSVKGYCVKDALVLARERGDATLSGSTLEFVYIKTLLSISHDSFPSGALARMNSLAHCASR
jgi:hypothetical protein